MKEPEGKPVILGAMHFFDEKIERLETGRSLVRRRSRR